MRCSDCGSAESMNTGKEIICKNCGLILEEDFLEQPFLSDVQKEIAKDGINRPAGTGNIQGKIFKNSWFEEHSEKQLQQYYTFAEDLGIRLKLTSKVITESKELIKKAYLEIGFQGKSSENYIVACIYASTFIHNQTRSVVELQYRTNISKYVILKYYKRLAQRLRLPICRENVPDLLELYLSRLRLPPSKLLDALAIWEKVKLKPELQLKPSYVIASALIYKVYNISQRKIVYVSGAHETALRRVLKLI